MCNILHTSALTPDGGLINGVGALSMGIYHFTVGKRNYFMGTLCY